MKALFLLICWAFVFAVEAATPPGLLNVNRDTGVVGPSGLALRAHGNLSTNVGASTNIILDVSRLVDYYGTVSSSVSIHMTNTSGLVNRAVAVFLTLTNSTGSRLYLTNANFNVYPSGDWYVLDPGRTEFQFTYQADGVWSASRGGTGVPAGNAPGQQLVWTNNAWTAMTVAASNVPDGTATGQSPVWTNSAWVAMKRARIIELRSGPTVSASDGATYYAGSGIGSAVATTFTNASKRILISGTIQAVNLRVRCAAGSNESVTHALTINDTANTALTSGTYDNNSQDIYTGSLSVAVNSATDWVGIKITTPAWATNPTGVQWEAQLYVSD